MIAERLEDAADEALFGGKAASLARAATAGLPVPGGFALSWEACNAIVAGDDETLRRAKSLFRDLDRSVSVRSSAVGEDSAEASFAGQHLTVLNVDSESSFVDAIRRVHASAGTSAAVQYRERMHSSKQPGMGIVVQIMVNADVAGVLFTRNPLTGADERVIESSWGLGEAVVAGIVTPDRYRLTPAGEIGERTAGHKDVEIRMVAAGTEERPVDDTRARALSLGDTELAALHELATLCQRKLGEAIDIEWAFENGRVYLLQSRPITSVHAPAPRAEPSPRASGIGWRRGGGFALAAILSPLNSTMIAVALPAIGMSFDAGPATLTLWLVTAYLIASIVVQSPAGKLVDVFGYSRILTTGRVIFALGAIAGAMAPSLPLLGIARVMMAVGGALNIPTVMAELRNEVAPEYRGRLFGAFGALMGTAAAIGPLVGGVLVRELGWHSLFLINLPIIAVSLLLEPPHRTAPPRAAAARFDVAGTLLFALAIGLVVSGVLSGGIRSLLMLGAGVVAFVLFALQSRRAADPLFDLSLFRARPFIAGSSIVGLQNFAMYAVLFLVPFLLTRIGRESGYVGAILLAMTGAMVVSSPIGGRCSDAFGPVITATFGALLAATGAVAFILGDMQATSLVASLVMLGAGLGLATSPSQAAALSAVPPARAGVAAGMISTLRYAGGVLGTAIVGMIATRTSGTHPLVWLFPLALLISAVAALFLGGPVLRARRKD